MSHDEWTDEEFDRLTARLRAFKSDPGSLSPEVYAKRKAFHDEVRKDSRDIRDALAKGKGLTSTENEERAKIIEWLAKTP